MTRSWLDNEKTRRVYRLTSGLTCVVQNEFQKVKCPHCQQVQYCRLTHIWYVNTDGRCTPEYHTNYDPNLGRLKELLVTYTDGVGVRETEIDGKWVLLKGGEVVGEELVQEPET